MRRLTLLVALIVGVGVALGVSGAASPSGSAKTRWVMTDLGTLGGRYSTATAVNAAVQVVGTSRTVNGEQHVFLWQAGRMRDLGRYDGEVLLNERGQVAWNEQRRGAVVWDGHRTTAIGSGVALAGMNDHGQIAAFSETRAFLWGSGKIRYLGVLPGFDRSDAAAINDSGQIVGSVWNENTPETTRAFLWEDGTMRNLGVLSGFDSSVAVAINENGQVLGFCAREAPERQHAFIWTNGKMIDLNRSGSTWVYPVALNNHGLAIVRSPATAFLWANGKLTKLETLGGANAEAFALNEQGQVVGRSQTAAGKWHASIWQDGTVTDIGAGRWSSAANIDNQAHVAGVRSTGKTFQGNRIDHAVLWTLRSGG